MSTVTIINISAGADRPAATINWNSRWATTTCGDTSSKAIAMEPAAQPVGRSRLWAPQNASPEVVAPGDGQRDDGFAAAVPSWATG